MPAPLRDVSYLSEGYLPPNFPGRDKEFRLLCNHFQPFAQGKAVRHIWIHGPPGTGKTSVVRSLLNEMEDRHGVVCAFVNCWDAGSFYSILDKLIYDFRILGAERVNAYFKLESLEKHLGSRGLLLALDEIDRLPNREREAAIYNFCGLSHAALICISNSRYSYFTSDGRVRSRLDALLVDFPSYTNREIQDIVRYRAEWSLSAGAASDQILGRISRISGGDARVAVQTLREAASRAEIEGESTITFRHLQESQSKAKETKRKYLIEKMSHHHALVYSIIVDAGEIASRALREEYLRRCGEARMTGVAPRTFCLYLNQLESRGLIQHERAVGVKGNVRLFRVRR